jgi:transposase-like protein
VHFVRDLVGMVGAGKRKEVAAELRGIFAATTREQAMTIADEVAARWQVSHPAIARPLEEGVDDGLACRAFPLAHRPRIRTTNGLERLHEEIKRRTRVVRIFPSRAACLRLVTALCIEQAEEWLSGRCYLARRDLSTTDRPDGPGMR